jgi:hypothetical protein
VTECYHTSAQYPFLKRGKVQADFTSDTIYKTTTLAVDVDPSPTKGVMSQSEAMSGWVRLLQDGKVKPLPKRSMTLGLVQRQQQVSKT